MSTVQTDPGIVAAGTGWTVPELEADPSWRFDVAADEAAATVEAARRTSDRQLLELHADDLPVGPLEGLLRRVAEQLTPGTGRGIAVIRGLPIEDLSEQEVERLYWALGLRIGSPVSQNLAGEFMCHVRTQPGIPNRGFAAPGELAFHCDMTEIAGLLAVKEAKVGGESAFASLATVHDVMLEECPELLAELYRPFYFSRLAEEHEWERPFSVQPVFARDGDRWGAYFNGSLITHALGIPGVPPLRPAQQQAMDALLAIANRPEHRLQFPLRPGCIAIFNNTMVMHARTNFEDHDDASQRRHLLRLWLDSPRIAAVPWPVRYDFRYGNSGLTTSGVVAGEQSVRHRTDRATA